MKPNNAAITVVRKHSFPVPAAYRSLGFREVVTLQCKQTTKSSYGEPHSNHKDGSLILLQFALLGKDRLAISSVLYISVEERGFVLGTVYGVTTIDQKVIAPRLIVGLLSLCHPKFVPFSQSLKKILDV